MDIFAELKRFDLPADQYVVFGSGPLMAHGIRGAFDIDLFVTPELYRLLKADGWEEKTFDGPHGGLYLVNGIYEADDTWEYGTYNPTPEEVIAEADIIEGVPFAPLTEVLKWKRAFGHPKDQVDVELVERYLRA